MTPADAPWWEPLASPAATLALAAAYHLADLAIRALLRWWWWS